MRIIQNVVGIKHIHRREEKYLVLDYNLNSQFFFLAKKSYAQKYFDLNELGTAKNPSLTFCEELLNTSFFFSFPQVDINVLHNYKGKWSESLH